MEAKQLLEENGAFSIKNYEELSQLLDKMMTDTEYLKEVGGNADNYVRENLGASEKILDQIKF